MILFFSCRVEWKNGSLFSQRSTLLLCRWYRPFVVVGEKKVVSVTRTIIHQLRRRFTADLTSIIVRTRVGQNFVLFFLEAAPLHRLVKFCIFFQGFFFLVISSSCCVHWMDKRISARYPPLVFGGNVQEQQRGTSFSFFWQQLLAKRIDICICCCCCGVGRDANNLAVSRPRALHQDKPKK